MYVPICVSVRGFDAMNVDYICECVRVCVRAYASPPSVMVVGDKGSPPSGTLAPLTTPA